MSLPVHPYRCFVDEQVLEPGRRGLSPEEARHLVQVRRAQPGMEVTVLNGRGHMASAVVSDVEKRAVVLDLTEVAKVDPPAPCITLVVGALKQSAWDEVLKHAVELQVNRIVRVQTRHAVSDVSGKQADKKILRWRECMMQACKQSANAWMPELDLAEHVADAFENCSASAVHLVATLGATAMPLHRALADERPAALICWIGPEGDFSSDEQEILLTNGAREVSLGRVILRAETAALALLAALRLRTG